MITGKKVLLLDTIHPVFNDILRKKGFLITDGTKWNEEEIIANLGSYNGICIRSRIKLGPSVLSHARALHFIARGGAGMENIDVAYAESKNICCINAPEGNRTAVGEHAIAMILSLFNHLNRADDQVRKGIWKREENRGTELEGKTVGVIGFGQMGSAFVQKLAGFGVQVLVYDKYKDFENGSYYRKAALEELFQNCDVLSLHIPLTAETEYMVDDNFISSFKKAFYLINTARGKNVNTADLVRHIRSGKIIGAALDVLEYELPSFETINVPVLPEPYQFLISSNRVLLSPHIAGWTHESNYKIAAILAQKILNHYSKSGNK